MARPLPVVRSLLTAACLALAATSASAQSLTTLYRFSGTDGRNPQTAPVLAGDGNLYGTTASGGANGGGNIYRLAPGGALTVLFNFPSGVGPGGVVVGSDGAVYGVTVFGGPNGSGSVFRVGLDGAVTDIHDFDSNGDDPYGPSQTGLILGADGRLYGTTLGGGTSGVGTLFALTTAGALTVIHPFTLVERTGGTFSKLSQGSDGNFYGADNIDGANGLGYVFRVTPAGVLTNLHSFSGQAVDGTQPVGGVVLGNDGNIYGTTSGNAGVNGGGTLFRLSPGGALTTLLQFGDGGSGTDPVGALVKDGSGNIYGTTQKDGGTGSPAGQGTVFEVAADGTVTTVGTLVVFTGGSDGGTPLDGVSIGPDGNLYGETAFGGNSNAGTVFKIAIASNHPAFFAGEAALANGVYYLAFPDGNFFGYYSYLSDPHYIYHFDLGYEYVFDAADGKSGVYLYDFASGTFFYTSPAFPFPYLYDFSLNSTVYYYPDTTNPGHYTSNPRYFFDFASGKIITK